MKNIKMLLATLSVASVLALSLGLAACGDEHSHAWSTTFTQDGDRHYQTCNGCDEKNYASHDFTNGNCVCGKVKPVTHTHTFSSDWSFDDDYHWHAATCEHTAETKDKSEHDFTNGNCVCGKKKSSDSEGLAGKTFVFESLTIGGAPNPEFAAFYEGATIIFDDDSHATLAVAMEGTRNGEYTVEGNTVIIRLEYETVTATYENNSLTIEGPMSDSDPTRVVIIYIYEG